MVEDCVNKVGVDLNTASASLLEPIFPESAKPVAKNIVAYREENGRFTMTGGQLLKVAEAGPEGL